VDIVVKGRNVEVPDHYRQLVSEKITRLERYDSKVIRVDVELSHEPNPRQSPVCQRVEITCKSRGPVVRAEAAAEDFYSALDTAIGKLESRLRRAADRRRVHHGTRTPKSVASATAGARPDPADAPVSTLTRPEGAVLAADRRMLDGAPRAGAPLAGVAADGAAPDGGTLDRADDSHAGEEHLPGRVVREKEHPGEPITLDQALLRMELVGHDFYLFVDADSGRPSVIYRRRGYDYGLLRLTT